MRNDCISLSSKILGREIPVRLLVPQGENLKCLILLHGYNGTQEEWLEQSPIRQLAEQFHLVVAMPSCGNGYYEDTHEDMPRFVGEELPAYLRETLPVSTNRDDLFLGGVSMGGFGALLIGAKYPQTFGKIVCFSGAFIIPDVVIGNPGVLGNANPQYFKEVFGDFETLEGSRKDPLAEAMRAAEKGSVPSVCLLCGREDVLYQNNVHVVKTLRKHNIPVLWYPGQGNHDWSFWNDKLPAVIKWLAEDAIPEGIN